MRVPGIGMERTRRGSRAPSVWIGCVMIAFLPSCGRQAPPAEEREAVPVEVTVIAPESVRETTVLTGILGAYRAVDVVSEVAGEIVSIRRDLGDRVAAGEILASVDRKVARESLNQADARVMAAEAASEMARVDFQRDSTLFFEGTSSEAVYQRGRLAMTSAEAERLAARSVRELAERQLAKTDVRAPFGGYVSRRTCDLGSYVSPGFPVFRIVDIDSLRLRLAVSQSEVVRVRPSMRVEVTVGALGDPVFGGSVRAVSPEADEMSRTYDVEVVLANPAGHPLKDGMVVRVELVLNAFEDALRIPREAVGSRGGDPYVFVVEDSTARRRSLQLGPLIDGHYLVVGGLHPGDRVVTAGLQNLRDGFPVSIEAAPPGPAPDEDDSQ